MAEKQNKVFETLNAINVNDKTEKKNGLTYLSWAWAWGELKKKFPDANYTVYENADGWNYHTDGRTAWVKVGVTVEGQEHIEMLPVMDFKNKSILLDDIDSYAVNKAIQRALTKAIARHGLGLYIYAGEDLPEEEVTTQEKGNSEPKKTSSTSKAKKPAAKPEGILCHDCGNTIKEHMGVTPQAIAEATKKKYGFPICMDCSAKRRAQAAQEAQKIPEDEGELPFSLE